MLSEFKIFIIFKDYSQIKTLIFSLLSLLFPLKWDLPIVSYINTDQSDIIETQFSAPIGIPVLMKQYLIKTLKKLDEEAVVYDITVKKF